MTPVEQEREARIQSQYEAVPEHIREDLVEAAIWAREVLTRHEGGGHHFEISAYCTLVDGQFVRDGSLQCSFAKASWAGDHCGQPMDSAAEAIVRAVCEYLYW
jgi:hypothetical protein